MQDDIDRLFREAPKAFGLPGVDELFCDQVVQGYQDTCAVRSQELILRDFGFALSEDQLAQEAYERGWYAPGGGTPPDAVGNLLELHGVSVNRYEDANIFNLTNELAQGHRVIVAVDSGELYAKHSTLGWLSEKFEDAVLGDRPDHAIIVSGVDVSDPAHPVVVVTDPGTGEVAATYPLADFLQAWEDAGFSMWATETAPPSFPMAHVDSIGQLPYDTFVSWYSSLGNLDSSDAAFTRICDEFDRCLEEPEYYREHPLPDLLPDEAFDPTDDEGSAEDLVDAWAFDLDGDSLCDGVLVDRDGDGAADVALDTDGDGLPDVEFDVDDLG